MARRSAASESRVRGRPLAALSDSTADNTLVAALPVVSHATWSGPPSDRTTRSAAVDRSTVAVMAVARRGGRRWR